MGAVLLTYISAASAVVGVVQGIEQRNEAKSNAAKAAAEQKKIKAETAAQQAARAAEERRGQIREERVKRARVIAAGGSGGAGSSGEFGALGSLSTNLGTNLGINKGREQAGENISQFSQNAADYTGKANQNLANASQADSLFNLSTNIFSASGGASNIGKSIFSTSSDVTDSSYVTPYRGVQ